MEYPKYLHREGKPSVIVNNADEEAAQLAAWDAELPKEPAPNKLTKK